MNDMQAKYKSEGLRFIAINLDRERAKADKFLADMPVNIDIAFDATGKTPKQYEVFGMPSAYIIGRDGTILYSHIGFETNKVKLYEKHIQSALAAQ
jgi:peroxiredoxin